MKENYIIAAFRETVAQRFPEQGIELNRLLDERLSRLRSMHLNASKGKQFHLESQILPGIAAYETLQTVMPKDEALQTVHGYVAEHAWAMRKTILKLLKVPGLYHLPPVLFSKLTPKFYGETAGFAATEYQTSGGVWRIDMTSVPITTPVSNTAVRSSVPASATATTSPMTTCTRSSSGTAQRRSAAGMSAATSA